MKNTNFGKPLSRLIIMVAICMLSLHAMAYDFSYTHQGTTLGEIYVINLHTGKHEKRMERPWPNWYRKEKISWYWMRT